MFDQTEFACETIAGLNETLAQPLDAAPAATLCDARRRTHARPRIVVCRRRLLRPMRLHTSPRADPSRLTDESLAVFSHEVRSSLGAIHNAAYILRFLHAETSAGDNARRLIERQVGRMARLIDDLVDVSRIKGAELPLQRSRIDLRVVVRHAVETVESDLIARNHQLTASLSDMPVWVHGDPGRLEQVLVNLLANAAKYTEDGGTVSVTVDHKAGEAIVRVRDSGIGIAADVLPCVFNLFVQADHSSRRAEGGLGIGLALVRRFIEMHGGSIAAASAGLGRGSEFTVRLPIACV
jgi:signal transduction histidine kinase